MDNNNWQIQIPEQLRTQQKDTSGHNGSLKMLHCGSSCIFHLQTKQAQNELQIIQRLR